MNIAAHLKQLFGTESPAADHTDLYEAIATLMLRAAMIDGQADDIELERVVSILQTELALSPSVAAQYLTRARDHEREAVNLYRYTALICQHYDQQQRQQILALLWKIVLADGREDDFEIDYLARMANLLGISVRDRVMIGKKLRQSQQAPETLAKP